MKKLQYENWELKYYQDGGYIQLSIRGVNDFKDFLYCLNREESHNKHGSYHKGLMFGATMLFNAVDLKVDFKKCTVLQINGHSMGGGIAVFMAELIYETYGVTPHVQNKNPYAAVDNKYAKYLRSIMTVKNYIYRNDWLGFLQNTFWRKYTYVGEVIHSPKPNPWLWFTFWGDHSRSTVK